MIFQNAELHGVTELTPAGDGSFRFHRAAAALEPSLSEGGRDMNTAATGVEVRFVLHSGKARVTLVNERSDMPLMLMLYYGSVMAGWQSVRQFVEPGRHTLEIDAPSADFCAAVRRGWPDMLYAPEMVRLVFQVGRARIVSVEGDVTPPTPDMAPARTLLCYGSSITHGSLSILPTNSYVVRVAEALGMDYRNCGYAGNCRMEPEMADYLAQQPFDACTLEMGVNVLGMDPAEYERRVRYLVRRVAESHPDKPVFAIDVFYCDDDLFGRGWAARYRAILARVTSELALPNVHYVNGLRVLPDARGLSGDLVHPSVRGVETLAANLSAIMKAEMGQ